MSITSTDLVKARLWQTPADGDAWDTLLDELVLEADSEVEQRLQRTVEQATYTEYYDGTGTPGLWLRQGPLGSVTRVDSVTWAVDGSAPVATPTQFYGFHPDGLLSEGHTRQGLLRYIGGVWTPGHRNYKVEYVAGWLLANIPPMLIRAATNYAVYLFLTREIQGQQSKVIGDAQANQLSPKQVDDAMDRAIGPFRFGGFA